MAGFIPESAGCTAADDGCTDAADAGGVGAAGETVFGAKEFMLSVVSWSCVFILSNCEAPSFGSCVPADPLKESLTVGVTAFVRMGSIGLVLFLCTLLSDLASVSRRVEVASYVPFVLLIG